MSDLALMRSRLRAFKECLDLFRELEKDGELHLFAARLGIRIYRCEEWLKDGGNRDE